MNGSNIQTDDFIQTDNLALTHWVWLEQPTEKHVQSRSVTSVRLPQLQRDWLKPIRQWLDRIEITNAEMARSICKLIPAQCPFERTVKVFGRTLFHIPPMCKLNPVYEQVVGLRFRALCYLADVCGEDVTPYC
ncbi:nitrogenase [filamentous cyanobacterium CCP1]|nr:nitrogenase [filamentous cyanobacterium CCP2]PSB66758.1 nitrogenase [filamentous cyanobacterium CCP1]